MDDRLNNNQTGWKKHYEMRPINNYLDVVKQDCWFDLIDIGQHEDYVEYPKKGITDLGIIVFYVYQSYIHRSEKFPDGTNENCNLLCLTIDECTILRLNPQGKLFILKIQGTEPVVFTKQLTSETTVNEIIETLYQELSQLDVTCNVWQVYLQRLCQEERASLVVDQQYLLFHDTQPSDEGEFVDGVQLKNALNNQYKLFLKNSLWLYYVLEPFIEETELWEAYLSNEQLYSLPFLFGDFFNVYGDEENIYLGMSDYGHSLILTGQHEDIYLLIDRTIKYQNGRVWIDLFDLLANRITF